MHRLAFLIVAGLVGIAGGVADAGPAGKTRTYTNTQQHGLDTVHLTKVTFAPLPGWKEHLDAGSTLPAFQK